MVNLLRNALSNFVPHLMSLPEKSVSSPDAVRDLIQFVPISLYNVLCHYVRSTLVSLYIIDHSEERFPFITMSFSGHGLFKTQTRFIVPFLSISK